MLNIEVFEEDIDELIMEHNSSVANTRKHWNFDSARRHVLKNWDDVQACPGSGKTTLVAAKLLIIAKKWSEQHKGICVLTHTNVSRDEIISRLKGHPAGYQLIAYPHFVGTIQEFTDKFLALPYIRTRYEFKRLIEDTEGQLEVRRAQIDGHTINQICQNLYHRCKKAQYEEIKNYLGSLHFLNSQGDLRFFKQNNSPEDIPASSTSDRRRMLLELKEALCRVGVFQYRDMYAFAEKLITENSDIVDILRKRFPIVFIDEMQDTQNYQDTLLNHIFDAQEVYLQRFGDPDQAIFDGIGGEETNESYNNKEGLYEIKTSHRFGNDICEKIAGLSYNRLDELTSCRDPERGECQHTIFLYDDDSTENVLDAFGDLVKTIDHDQNWHVIKAVGGVDGENGEIRKFWTSFDKNHSPISPKPKKLIHIVRLCAIKTSGHVSANYDLLIQGVVDFLRKENVKTTNSKGDNVYFTKQSLVRWLKEDRKFVEFRKILTSWLLDPVANADNWRSQIENLKAIINLNELSDEGEEFVEFDGGHHLSGENHASVGNKYTCANGCDITVGTIHSVKGETHDATLILETKFNTYDIQQILPYIIEKKLPSPTGVQKKEFLRKLYVAASRPRHLLCLALHGDHINNDQVASLKGLGWNITYLGDSVATA